MKTHRPSLQLETLEERLTPVTWPVSGTAGQPVELLGTYGQYQEWSAPRKVVQVV